MCRRWLPVFVMLGVSSCSETRPVTLEDAGRDGLTPLPDAPAADVASDLAGRDAPIALDRSIAPDLWIGPDLGDCYCKPGEVWRRSSCVPTVELGCGPTCDPADPTSCPTGRTCDQWAAAPCCMCSAAVPACVPTASTGPIAGPLRIQPTSGTAGQPVTITVEGASFYIGALFYMIRMDQDEKMDMSGSKPCSVSATFTPPTPGVHVVEVSQYGGGAPWVLAGFYVASGGMVPMPTIQPGYPCKANPAPGDPACLQGGAYACACVSGRCQCK